MNTIHTDDKRIFSQSTGLLFASNPFNYTINNLSGLIVGSPSAVRGICALDNLSDEIGITHETVEGEIV